MGGFAVSGCLCGSVSGCFCASRPARILSTSPRISMPCFASSASKALRCFSCSNLSSTYSALKRNPAASNGRVSVGSGRLSLGFVSWLCLCSVCRSISGCIASTWNMRLADKGVSSVALTASKPRTSCKSLKSLGNLALPSESVCPCRCCHASMSFTSNSGSLI